MWFMSLKKSLLWSYRISAFLKVARWVALQLRADWSLSVQAVGCWLLNDIIYFKLRKIKLLSKLSKYQVSQQLRRGSIESCLSWSFGQNLEGKQCLLNIGDIPMTNYVRKNNVQIWSYNFFSDWDKLLDSTANSQLLEQIQTTCIPLTFLLLLALS